MVRLFQVLARMTGCLAIALFALAAFVAPDRAARATFGDSCATECADAEDYDSCVVKCCAREDMCGTEDLICQTQCQAGAAKCPVSAPKVNKTCNNSCNYVTNNTCNNGLIPSGPGTCLTAGGCAKCTCKIFTDPISLVPDCYCF